MTLHPAQDESVANYCLTRLLMRGLKTRILGERPEHSVSSDGSSDKGRLFLLTAQVRKNPTCPVNVITVTSAATPEEEVPFVRD